MQTPETTRRRMAVWRLVAAAVNGNQPGFIASLDALDWPEAWPDIFRELVAIGWVPRITRHIFVEMWNGRLDEFNTYPPDGTRLRAIFQDDVALLVDGLRILLPPLEGEPPPVLYRGQSEAEHASGVTGLSWTPQPTLAEIYARHPTLNEGPTVVLAKFEPGEAIIGQVSDLEIILDPRRIGDVHLVYAPTRKLTDAEFKDARAPRDLDILKGIFEDAREREMSRRRDPSRSDPEAVAQQQLPLPDQKLRSRSV